MLNGHGIHEIWALSGISIAVICAAVLVRYGNSLSSTYGGSAGLVVGHDIAPSRLLQGLAPHHAMPYNAIPYHITPYHIVILFAACFTLTVSSLFHITLLHWKNVIKHLMPSISEWRWCHCCAYLYIQGFGILRINVCFVYIDVQCVGSQQLLRPGRRHHVELSRHDRGKLHAASLQTADHFFFRAVTSEDKEG